MGRVGYSSYEFVFRYEKALFSVRISRKNYQLQNDVMKFFPKAIKFPAMAPHGLNFECGKTYRFLPFDSMIQIVSLISNLLARIWYEAADDFLCLLTRKHFR